ncbi:unnamed protein product [Closterium sp. NIES-54]
MGHVALPILQQLVKDEMVAGIHVKGEPDEILGCPTCMQAKFTRYPFSSSEATAKAPRDEVVMDVVGPLKLGAAGAEYFLTIVDVYTRMTWVYVLSKKSDVAETVKTDWLLMVERQKDRLVKAIRTDRGGEFLSKEFSLWLKNNGIRHSLTMPYSPAMNGIAERANRTITETARGLFIEAGLPEYFWPDAVRSACVAKNRALTHVGADKWVPYVEWIGRKPKVDMLRVFGCMCMALVPKHLRHNKLGAKAIWAVHLGMAQNSKGWLLWDPFTKKFLVSKDCKFMENLMYKDWKAENEAKIGMRFGEVNSSGLEHVELPLELSSSSTTTRKFSLVNGGEEAKDAEEEEEEVQQVSERAPTLPSRTTSAPQIRVTPQQRQGLHVPAAEEEGRGKRRIQAPNRLTNDALGKPAKSALAGAALIVGDDEESDYDECAFVFFSPVEMPGEPATLKEALESSDAEEWKKAMESELKSIEENDTWELVELPEGRKAITSKWLFKIKSDADGKMERYKSRLVVKGYQQKEKVDYKKLFAPVVKPTTLRTLRAGAAIKGWMVKQMDVTTAFLNGVLEEEIFMAQTEGFDDGSGRVLRLKKALYGLKQAPRQWYLKLRGVLEEIGFTPSSADHSLFMLGEGEQRSFMVVNVDDILIFSPSSDLVKELMLKLQDKFKCKALGDVSFYLGLHIERDVEKRCMRVHQRKYLEALAASFGQSEGHVATPFPSGFKCVKGPEEESVGEEERHRFHSLVGSLMYAAVNTRPDVAFATGQLARVVQCPNKEQVAAGMRVAKYLGQTPTVGLQYSASAQRRQKGADGVEPVRLFLTAFSDASFASEPEDMTSVGGFICCVGGGPTAWESKKQVDQALSSVESEYMALFRAVREIVWQRRLLAELGEEQQGPTPLYCDSQGAIALAKNPVLHGLTKHMRVKWHWTRSMVAAVAVVRHRGSSGGSVVHWRQQRRCGAQAEAAAVRRTGGSSGGRAATGVVWRTGDSSKRAVAHGAVARGAAGRALQRGAVMCGAAVRRAAGRRAAPRRAEARGAAACSAAARGAVGRAMQRGAWKQRSPLELFSTMAGPEERGGRGAGGSGEAQAQGQPRDSAMAPMQPSLGPPRDEPRVLGLEKFNGDNFAKWSFKMENIFDHYDLLEVMEGTKKRPENDPEKSPWVRKSAQGYLLLGQALGSSLIRHIKPFQREPEKGPKAWAALKGVHAPATAAVAVVLERQMAALRIEEDEAVEEGVQKFFDLLTRLEGADLNYTDLQKKTKLLALLPESWSLLIINLNRDLPRLSLEDMKRAILQEDFRRRELASADGAGAASIGRGYGRGRGRGRGGGRFGGSNCNGGPGSSGHGNDNKNNGRGRGRFDGECHFSTRADTCGAIATNSLMDGLLLKAKRVEEQEEGEEEAVEAVAVVEVVLQV